MSFSFRQTGYVISTAILFFVVASSSSAGGRWVKQESNTLAWLRSVYFLNENKGWVVGTNGTLLTTDDGGITWKALASGTTNNLLDVVFLNEHEGWMICESNKYELRRGETRTYLLYTFDGAESWHRVNMDGYSRDLSLTRIIFDKNGKGWLLGESGTFYTTDDGGQRWIGKPAPSRFLLLGGTMTNSQQGVLVGAASTIVYTSDGGINWRTGNLRDNNTAISKTISLTKKEPLSIRFTSVSFADEKLGVAVGYSGQIYVTNDGGKNWNAQKSDVTDDLFDAKFLNPNEGWIIGDKGTLLYTANKGNNWESVNLGTTHRLERIFFITPERGWIVGFGGTILTFTADNKNPQLKAITQ